MTVLELIEANKGKFDVCGTYGQYNCSPYYGTKLTKAGLRHYKRALSLNVYIFDGRWAVIECDTRHDEQALSNLFGDMVLYTAYKHDEYSKYFYDD